MKKGVFIAIFAMLTTGPVFALLGSLATGSGHPQGAAHVAKPQGTIFDPTR